jgi:DNA-directed RNA polymerase subunit M/transcription elongation factor TFIIS
MALPKLNDSPKYEIEVPSTGKVVRYRPYLVKEEKVLMIAFESGNQKQALQAIVDTLSACIQDKIDLSGLSTFDIEYLFTQIRSKSVGETSTVMLKCSSCEKQNEYSFDISSVKIEMPDVENVIEISPSISVEMRYPSYESVINTDLNAAEMEVGFNMVLNSITAILTEEERIATEDVSRKELVEFVESMDQVQFKKLAEYLRLMPALEHEAKFKCMECGEDNELMLRGMQDFLS